MSRFIPDPAVQPSSPSFYWRGVAPSYQNHPIVQEFFLDFQVAARALLTKEGNDAPLSVSRYWEAELKKMIAAQTPYESSEFFSRRMSGFANRFNALGPTVDEAVRTEKQEFVNALVADRASRGLACYVSCDYVFEYPYAPLVKMARELDKSLARDQQKAKARVNHSAATRSSAPAASASANGFGVGTNEQELLRFEDLAHTERGSKSIVYYDNGTECRVCKGETYCPYAADCPNRANHHKWYLKLEHALTLGGWRNSLRQLWDATGQYQSGQNELAQADYDWLMDYTSRVADFRAEQKRAEDAARQARNDVLSAFYEELDGLIKQNLKFKWGTLALGTGARAEESKLKLYYDRSVQPYRFLFGVRNVNAGHSSRLELTHIPSKLLMDKMITSGSGGSNQGVTQQDLLRFIYLLLLYSPQKLDLSFTRLEDISAQTKDEISKITRLVKEHLLPGDVGMAWPPVQKV